MSCKTSWKTYLQYVLLKPFPDVFKTSSRRVCKTSCNYVFKTSTRRLRDVLEYKKMLHWRRLEEDFKMSLVRLHQDKCLLGRRFICSSRNWKLSLSEFLSKDADSFLEFFFFGCFFHIFTVANQLPGFSISRLANVDDFLNANILLNCKYKCDYEKFSFKYIYVVCYLKLCFYCLTWSVTNFRDLSS